MSNFLTPLLAKAEPILYYAATVDEGQGRAGADNFLNSAIGTVFLSLFGVAGIVVIAIAIIKSVGGFMGGKIGKSIGILVGGLLIGGLCFSLAFLPDLIEVFQGLWKDIVRSVDDLT